MAQKQKKVTIVSFSIWYIFLNICLNDTTTDNDVLSQRAIVGPLHLPGITEEWKLLWTPSSLSLSCANYQRCLRCQEEEERETAWANRGGGGSDVEEKTRDLTIKSVLCPKKILINYRSNITIFFKKKHLLLAKKEKYFWQFTFNDALSDFFRTMDFNFFYKTYWSISVRDLFLAPSPSPPFQGRRTHGDFPLSSSSPLLRGPGGLFFFLLQRRGREGGKLTYLGMRRIMDPHDCLTHFNFRK